MRARSLAGALGVATLVACATPATQGVDAPAAAGPPAGRSITLVNGGFELAIAGGNHPPGWVPIHHASTDSYVFTLDEEIRRSGSKSLRIANIGPEPFGSIVQKVRNPALRGQTIRYSAWLRTRDARGSALGGGGALMAQAMRNGVPVAHDHMRGAEVKGTTDWQRRSITLAIPADADDVEIGAMLFGAGTLWLDDAALEIVGSDLAPSQAKRGTEQGPTRN
jgi:hypothetical protein